MVFDVHVPATLSNLGPGYDVLGLALDFRNSFRFEEGAGDSAPGSELVIRTLSAASERFGGSVPPLRVSQEERVPRSRGLGSSATARVAAVVAYLEITGEEPPRRELIEFLAEAEGHPDNAVPALLGGLTICADGGSVAARLDPPSLSVALCIPELEVSTDAARAAMPSELSVPDAVFGLSRMALLLTGLREGHAGLIREGVKDKLHQPTRSGLIGPVAEAFQAAEAAGAAGAFISGSGSTLAAFVLEGDAGGVAEAMASVFRGRGVAAEARTASPASAGALDSVERHE